MVRITWNANNWSLNIEMAEYWLVSAPGDPTPKETWEEIKDKTGTMSLVNKLTLPDLKVRHGYIEVTISKI